MLPRPALVRGARDAFPRRHDTLGPPKKPRDKARAMLRRGVRQMHEMAGGDDFATSDISFQRKHMIYFLHFHRR